MILLRVYLLAGLLAHKALWEILKRKEHAAPKPVQNFSLRIVKAAKVALLLGVLVQTVLPFEVLKISPEPFSLRVAGVILYTAGLFTAMLGRLQLGKNWADIETPQVEGEIAVVSQGLYRYIRHPIYTGDLLLLLGLELSLNSWLALGLVALIPVVFQRAVGEEKMLAKRLAGYDSYVQRTKRFIPFVV